MSSLDFDQFNILFTLDMGCLQVKVIVKFQVNWFQMCVIPLCFQESVHLSAMCLVVTDLSLHQTFARFMFVLILVSGLMNVQNQVVEELSHQLRTLKITCVFIQGRNLMSVQ